MQNLMFLQYILHGFCIPQNNPLPAVCQGFEYSFRCRSFSCRFWGVLFASSYSSYFGLAFGGCVNHLGAFHETVDIFYQDNARCQTCTGIWATFTSKLHALKRRFPVIIYFYSQLSEDFISYLLSPLGTIQSLKLALDGQQGCNPHPSPPPTNILIKVIQLSNPRCSSAHQYSHSSPISTQHLPVSTSTRSSLSLPAPSIGTSNATSRIFSIKFHFHQILTVLPWTMAHYYLQKRSADFRPL